MMFFLRCMNGVLIVMCAANHLDPDCTGYKNQEPMEAAEDEDPPETVCSDDHPLKSHGPIPPTPVPTSLLVLFSAFGCRCSLRQ